MYIIHHLRPTSCTTRFTCPPVMQVLGKWLPLVAATCSSIKTVYCAVSRKNTCVYKTTAGKMCNIKKKTLTLCMVSVSSQISVIDCWLIDLDMVSGKGGTSLFATTSDPGLPAYPAFFKTAIRDYSSG